MVHRNLVISVALLGSSVLLHAEQPNNQSPLIEMTQQLDEQNIIEQVSSLRPVIIDFSASWCGPCKQMKPILKQVAQELQDRYTFFVVDVDKFGNLATKYNIKSMPTFVVVVNGKEQGRCAGFQAKEKFKQSIEEILQPKDLSKLNKTELNERLQVALVSGTAEQIKALVKAGANINEASSNGLTPMQLFFSFGYTRPDYREKLQTLLDLKATVNFSIQGQTVKAVDMAKQAKATLEIYVSALDECIKMIEAKENKQNKKSSK